MDEEPPKHWPWLRGRELRNVLKFALFIIFIYYPAAWIEKGFNRLLKLTTGIELKYFLTTGL